MVSKVKSFSFQGVSVVDVDVEVHMSPGLPAFTIVGLPDKAVAESRERVRAALGSIGLALPAKRITVNLAPADLAKEGSHYDLPIALGLLTEIGAIDKGSVDGLVALGELSLDGTINPVSGILPAAIGARSRGKGILCPKGNGKEALWAREMEVLSPEHLLPLINHFKGSQLLPRIDFNQPDNDNSPKYPDISSVIGQEVAKRALEIAAAGGHNLLMVGPPGAGKSMLAKCLPGIMPHLTSRQMLDNSMIASIAGKLVEGGLITSRPFRDPHHSCSMAAMIGGGTKAKPGEVTLAHNGILFLDELPEFPLQVLDSLRQPLENRQVTVSRVNAHITYPANFQLVAAMNPCRCGYLGDAAKACSKAPKCGEDYQSKISGPLMDRIDICVEIPSVSVSEIEKQKNNYAETSEQVAERVALARNKQVARYEGYGIETNSQANGDVLTEFSFPDNEGKELLNSAVEKFGISMRGYNRIQRVARTIADLESSNRVGKNHIAEALSYNRNFNGA